MIIKDTLKNKKRSYISLAAVFVIFVFSVYTLFEHTLSNYLHNQISNEAISIAKTNSATLTTLNKSIHSIEEMLTNQLKHVAERLVVSSSYDNVSRNDLLSTHHLVDEVNWFSKEGVIIYSSKDYEGDVFPYGHLIWEVLQGDEEFVVEESRKDIYTDDYYKFFYRKAPDNTVVQVSIQTNRITELTKEFNYESFLSKNLDDSRVLSSAVYMSDGEYLGLQSDSEKLNQLSEVQLRVLSESGQVTVETSYDGRSVLEVFVGLNDESGNLFGTFFLAYSLEETEAFVSLICNASVLFLVIISLIFFVFVMRIFNSDKKLEKVQYIDSTTKLLNKQYILDKYDEIEVNNLTLDTKVVMFEITNYRRSQLLDSPENMDKRLNSFVNVIKKYSENEEVYRYSEDVFLLVSHHRSLDEVVQATNSILENNRSNFVLRAGIIERDEQFANVESLTEYIEITSLMLRDSEGQNQLVMNTEIRDQILQRQTIERDLRLLSVQGFGNQMHVEFQPQVDIYSGEVVGFETLARWIHPDCGYISPPLIFEIAEESDYSIALTRWIVSQAFEFINDLKAHGYNKQVISVNASTSYIINPEFHNNIRSLMDYYEICESQFGVEITESMFDESPEELKKRIKDLRDLGLKVSIDDYGRGYSSLMRLKELDVNVLKIDKAFVDDINIDDRIIQNILGIAKNLNLNVVAEGVEKEEQVEWLRKHNCMVIQGYFFSKPLKKDAAIEFLKNFRIESAAV